jgi:membrane associated rhomboid family serine protease
MILIPIGHEESGTRRLPWITFGIMIVCGVAFLLSGQASIVGSEDDAKIESSFSEALEYWLSRPYLELDPKFEKKVFPGGSAAEAIDEYYEFMGYSPDEKPSPGFMAMEQEVLDKLVAKAMATLDSHPLVRWGLVPNDISLIGLITHMFLHGGWMHLLGNMLILYLAGPFIEDVWGRPLYLAFYILSGLTAALIYIAFNMGSTVPMIGASGAIAGVMGAFLVRYKTTKLQFFYMIGFFWRGTFHAPAMVMLPLWFGEQLFFALAFGGASGAGGGIAYWAHVGGFAFGFGAAVAMKKWNIEEQFLASKIDSKVNRTLVDNSAVDRAMEAQTAGDVQQAYDILSREIKKQPANREVALALWSAALETGHQKEAARGMLRAIQHDLLSGDTDLAIENWAELNKHVPDAEIEAGLLVRMAQALDSHGLKEDAVVALRRALLAAGRGSDPTLALKIARLSQGLDLTVARGAAKLALSKPGLDPDSRTSAEQILAELPPPTPAPPALGY